MVSPNTFWPVMETDSPGTAPTVSAPSVGFEVVGPGAEGHEDGGRERACCGPVVGGSSAARSVQPDGATQVDVGGIGEMLIARAADVKSPQTPGVCRRRAR